MRRLARWYLRHDRWTAEFVRRWPLLVGVLRGKVVVFGASVGPAGLELERDAVVFDSTFTGVTVAQGNVQIGGTLTISDAFVVRGAVVTGQA